MVKVDIDFIRTQKLKLKENFSKKHNDNYVKT